MNSAGRKPGSIRRTFDTSSSKLTWRPQSDLGGGPTSTPPGALREPLGRTNHKTTGLLAIRRGRQEQSIAVVCFYVFEFLLAQPSPTFPGPSSPGRSVPQHYENHRLQGKGRKSRAAVLSHTQGISSSAYWPTGGGTAFKPARSTNNFHFWGASRRTPVKQTPFGGPSTTRHTWRPILMLPLRAFNIPARTLPPVRFGSPRRASSSRGTASSPPPPKRRRRAESCERGTSGEQTVSPRLRLNAM